jgi:DNA-binding NarL/FixJ family response regulator
MFKMLIVEDQIVLRECLQVLLEQDLEIEVAGFAGDGLEALE